MSDMELTTINWSTKSCTEDLLIAPLQVPASWRKMFSRLAENTSSDPSPPWHIRRPIRRHLKLSIFSVFLDSSSHYTSETFIYWKWIVSTVLNLMLPSSLPFMIQVQVPIRLNYKLCWWALNHSPCQGILLIGGYKIPSVRFLILLLTPRSAMMSWFNASLAHATQSLCIALYKISI